MVQQCKNCPDTLNMTAYLNKVYEDTDDTFITFNQWESIDR